MSNSSINQGRVLANNSTVGLGLGKEGSYSYMAALPLFITFVLFPIIQISTRLFGDEVKRTWIDGLWLGLLLLALTKLAISNNLKTTRYSRGVIGVFYGVIGLALVYFFGIPLLHDVVLIPYLMELKMPFYIIFSGCWLLAYGLPKADSFILCGKMLSIIVLVDLVIESAISGRWVAPLLSGEKNYDALLLVIALIMALGTSELGIGNSTRRTPILALILGILATSSRTALLALGVVFLISNQKNRNKIFVILASIVFVIISFVLRDLEFNIDDMDRYWMWASFFEFISENPSVLLTGFSVGAPLPINVPEVLTWLWESQQDSWNINGVYPFNFHAFWLRATITWGLLSFILFIYFFKLAASKKSSSLLRFLSVTVLIEGMTMGVFYLSNVAIPLILALVIAIRNQRAAANNV